MEGGMKRWRERGGGGGRRKGGKNDTRLVSLEKQRGKKEGER